MKTSKRAVLPSLRRFTLSQLVPCILAAGLFSAVATHAQEKSPESVKLWHSQDSVSVLAEVVVSSDMWFLPMLL